MAIKAMKKVQPGGWLKLGSRVVKRIDKKEEAGGFLFERGLTVWFEKGECLSIKNGGKAESVREGGTSCFLLWLGFLCFHGCFLGSLRFFIL